MRKWIIRNLALILASILALGMLWPAMAESPEAVPVEDGGEAAPEIEYPDELRVGHTTITKGDFFTEMLGNDTSDIDVRALIHGYNLVNWDQNQGVYLIDESVVENAMVVENDVVACNI